MPPDPFLHYPFHRPRRPGPIKNGPATGRRRSACIGGVLVCGEKGTANKHCRPRLSRSFPTAKKSSPTARSTATPVQPPWPECPHCTHERPNHTPAKFRFPFINLATRCNRRSRTRNPGLRKSPARRSQNSSTRIIGRSPSRHPLHRRS